MAHHKRSLRCMQRIIKEKTDKSILLIENASLTKTFGVELQNSDNLEFPFNSCEKLPLTNVDQVAATGVNAVNPIVTYNFLNLNSAQTVTVSEPNLEILDDNIKCTTNSNQTNVSNCNFDNNFSKSPKLADGLAQWAIEENINQSSLKKLMHLLNKCGNTNLPKDPRTILHTPTSLNVIQNNTGCYYYFGVENTINILCKNYNVSINENTQIKLAVNIDGLPLSKSTSSSFWPILCLIKSIKALKDIVFVVALYHVYEKLDKPDTLISDFVEECTRLIKNKICINGIKTPFNIEMLICDTPAKSFVLQLKGHSGYFACTKCCQEGDSIDGYVRLTETDFRKRTDANFRNRLQPEHHIGISLIEMLPKFNMIDNVPLDYMHLVCLGVVKRLLCDKSFGLIFGKPPYKLQALLVHKISRRLAKLKTYIPSEFCRKTRPITDCKRFKATEFRTFLLYTGPIVLKGILPTRQYTNFIVLSVAISILVSNHELEESWLSYAENLLQLFVSNSKSIYGYSFISHNVHNLLHLVDCARIFGNLDNFSAFPFENFMQSLLKKIRKSEKPLQQVIRRTVEENNLQIPLSKSILKKTIREDFICFNMHNEGPLLVGCTGPQYKKVITTNGTLVCSSVANKYIELLNGDVFEVKNFCFNENQFVMIGYVLEKCGDLFNKPCNSSDLDINVVNITYNKLSCVPFKMYRRKLVLLPFNESDTEYISLPLLHFN